MREKLDTNALFLGPKAENTDLFEKLMLESYRDHIFWRRNFHPEDPLALSQTDKRSESYEGTIDTFQAKFYELLSKLKKSVPYHSPRYIGHMTADLLMPALLGYFSTMLYNPNNVSYESSPVTSEMEIEVGRDLAAMTGFNPLKSWAHLTSGGTVANIEALWVIRNIKYFPLVAKDLAIKHKKEINVQTANGEIKPIAEIETDFELMSLSPESLSDLAFKFFEIEWDINIEQEVYKHRKNISHSGMSDVPMSKILVPSSKHYSWPKAAEILGIGRSNIVHVEVDENFRMKTSDLMEKLKALHNEKTPVLAVIGIVGTTECGSVDAIDEIVEIRNIYEKEFNSSFYIHLDAAYGGYARSLFLDENNEFRDFEEVKNEILPSWADDKVYKAFKAMKDVDSVTIDPHKLGYIPYPAGAIVFRDKRVKPATLCKAPYINNTTKSEDEDAYLGGYILEGSKSGAAAAACWLAHKVVPLNKTGYGSIISVPVNNAAVFYDLLTSLSTIKLNINGKEVIVETQILNRPDIDILLYCFNIKGNTSLKQMNKFNEILIEELSFSTEKVAAAHDFIVSSTDLGYEIYGNALNKSLDELKINLDEWQQNGSIIKVLRSSIVTPFLKKEDLKQYYWNNFSLSLVKTIEKVLKEGAFDF
jgi:glutamate/tyrosine decarboxylase-like PLP-dependent enzyme